MLALLTVSVVALIACGAFVMDVGAWIQGHRATQAVADASALAGAQALPLDTGTATSIALDYSTKNGGGVAGGDIQFASNTFPSDTIRVTARRTGAGFLSRVLGITTVNLTADAEARAYNLSEATYAAPFGIDKSESFLSGSGCPCYNVQTSFDLNKVGPGGFEILNIDGSQGGTGSETLADWILGGLNQSMPLGWYYSDPGAKFNSSDVESAMDSRVGSVLLFPVYDAIQEQRRQPRVPHRRLGRLLHDRLERAGQQRDDHRLSQARRLGRPHLDLRDELLRRGRREAHRLGGSSFSRPPNGP